MKKKKAYFIDIGYITKRNTTYAKLLVKGKKTTYLYLQYDPYFYVEAPKEEKETIKKIKVKRKNGEQIGVKKVEVVKRNFYGKEKEFLKVVCHTPKDVRLFREAIPYRCLEADIPFARRALIDFSLVPFSIIEYKREGRVIKEIIKIKESKMPKLKVLAFDIEVRNPLGMPRSKEDEIILISVATEEKAHVFTTKECNKKEIILCKNEREMIERFVEFIEKEDPDIIIGYNSSNFDLPYLNERSKVIGAEFKVGRWKGTMKKIKKGLISGVKIYGRIHIDLYPIARFFGFIGLIKAMQYTLKSVYKEITGKEPKRVERLDIWKMWDEGKIEKLVEYSLSDAKATYEVGEFLLPLEYEIAQVAKMPVGEVAISTSGQLVENLLLYESFHKNTMAPSRASDSIIRERMLGPVQGAFVKLPEPGIYERIAVLDFRGLYPSIIVSYNIDPYTLTKEKCNNCFESPTGAMFRKEKVGMIPLVLDELIETRSKIKRKLRELKKGSEEYKRTWARSHALKILSNSFYGYLGYARSRWYCRECAESVTAWGRKHILETEKKAKEHGFEVIYIDTDSVFLLMGEKKKEEVINFMKKINSELPGKMELELEDFYVRGVFVSKKGEEKGAKKKYALLSEDGTIKIRGFELVRRDWSKIARETQYKVLEAILKEGSKEKAVKIVREAIERLRKGEVNMDELVIHTQLNRPLEKYEVTSPELAAAKKAIARGIPIQRGSIVEYVITKRGRSISEKAELKEFAKDYDADYYINHQIIPAVLKILRELGYSKDDLKFGGKQQNLESFF